MATPKASNLSVMVPSKAKRDFVTERAESYGLMRVMDEDGKPMLIKKADVVDNPLDYVPAKKAKTIGPQVLAARG